MARTANRVKPTDTTSSSTGSGTTTSRYHHKRSARRVILAGILAALDLGPATTVEICNRMGFIYADGIHSLLLILERHGKVARIGHARMPNKKGPGARPILWARVIHPDKPRSNNKRHTNRPMEKLTDPKRAAHNKSTRGARP